MSNAGFPEQPQDIPPSKSEDIPAALRDTPDAETKVRFPWFIWLGGGVAGFVLLALLSGLFFLFIESKKPSNSKLFPASSNPATSQESGNSAKVNEDFVLGHFAYSEAPLAELQPITGDGRIKLRATAAQKYQEMAAAARSAGVILVPISGFRSIQEQEQLFFVVGAQRNQTPAQRAAVSAPPGHSEHHTGYAVDVGDGVAPSTNLNTNFEKTKAFQWLQANAARFSFELSFPQGNPQGVSYEPWHWRFVGDRGSLETFYRAKNYKPAQAK